MSEFEKLEKTFTDGISVVDQKLDTKANTELVEGLQKSLDASNAKIETLEEQVSDAELAIANFKASDVQVGSDLSTYTKSMRTYLTSSSPKSVSIEDKEKAVKYIVDTQYKHLDSNSKEVVVKNMMENIAETGGFLVSPVVENSIELLNPTWQNPIASRARKMVISAPSIKIPADEPISVGSWVAEGQSPTDETPRPFKTIQIDVHDFVASIPTTRDLLTDAAIDILAYIAQAANDDIAYKQEYCFLKGTGVGQPQGILSYPTTTADYEYGKLQVLTTEGSLGYEPKDFIKTKNAMHPMYRQNCAWLVGREAETDIESLESTAGDLLFKKSFAGDRYMTSILGIPVVVCADMDDIAAGSDSVILANLGVGYQIVENAGSTVLRDETTSFPNIKWKTFNRIGGAIRNFSCFKILRTKA